MFLTFGRAVVPFWTAWATIFWVMPTVTSCAPVALAMASFKAAESADSMPRIGYPISTLRLTRSPSIAMPLTALAETRSWPR